MIIDKIKETLDKKFIISSETASAQLVLDGAMLTSLMKDKTEYLWQGNKKYWAGQAPVCFPIVGVLPDGEATAFGKPCKMKRHGVARINPFEIESRCKNSITFLQKSSGATKEEYPFDYELRIKYTIVGDTVTNEYIIKNTGDEKMPFVIGGHPAFNCPLDRDEKFEDYKIIFDKMIENACLRPDHETGLIDVNKEYVIMNGKTELKLRHDLFEEKDAIIFENCPAKAVTLIGKNGKGMKVEFQDMNNLLVWSAVGKAPFVAIEPWTGISSCSDEDGTLEGKRGMTILQPDEEASFKFKMTMI